MFVGKARSLSKSGEWKVFHSGRLYNIAYYEYSLIAEEKHFITLGPGANVIKLFVRNL